MNNRFHNQPVPVEKMRAHVCAVGPNRIQNELLISFLLKEMNIKCAQNTKFPGMPTPINGNKRSVHLFLFDCQNAAALDPWLAFEINSVERKFGVYLVFYNVPAGNVLDQLALDRGIHGVFYSNDPVDMIPQALKAIMQGELWYRRDLLAKYTDSAWKKIRQKNSTACGLTYRQREILRLLVGGNSNRHIAESLEISHNTVRSHVFNIFQKIDVKSRLQAANWARQHLGALSG